MLYCFTIAQKCNKKYIYIYQWQVKAALDMHSGLTSKERCTKSPHKKLKPFYGEIPISGKMPIF